MKTFWKFTVADEGGVIEVPAGTTFTMVTIQHGVIALWGLVPDTEAPKEVREIHVSGTGHPVLGKNVKPIGTLFDGSFVWHIWEELK